MRNGRGMRKEPLIFFPTRRGLYFCFKFTDGIHGAPDRFAAATADGD